MTFKHSCLTKGFILAAALLAGGNALAAEVDAEAEDDDNVVVTTPKGPPPDDFVNSNDAAELAYTVAPVANGGTLRGTISFNGEVPEAKRFKNDQGYRMGIRCHAVHSVREAPPISDKR